MNQNKTGRYIKYAIGEIVLVVIGILIALQINNWNENRKIVKTEVSILGDLKEEFKKNREEVNASIKVNLDNTKSCIIIDSIIKHGKLSNKEKKIDSLLGTLGAISSFKPSRSIIDQIVSSGKSEILTNTKLKLLLANWRSELDKSNNDSKYTVENYTNNLMPFLMKYFPLSNGDLYANFFFDEIPRYKEKSSFKARINTLDKLEFENMIWHHKHNVDYLIYRDIKLKKLLIEIFKEIENSLESIK